jgi:hypothetical protein
VLLVANDFFRLAHHDVTGRARLHHRATGLGLAAGLLAELMFGQHLTAQEGVLHLRDQSPPADAAAHTVLDQIVAQSRHRELRTWLDYLSHDANELVARRLWRAGHVRPTETRRLLGRPTVTYVPTDINTAAWPWARLSLALHRHAPLHPPDAFLVGVATATGLDTTLLDAAPSATRTYARHVAGSLHPALRDLLVHTQAAVGDAVLAYRR